MSERSFEIREEIHFDGRRVKCYAHRPPHIDAMFRATVQAHGRLEALVEGERRLDYAMLDREVDRVASNLLRAGLQPGERIGLLIGNRIEFMLVVLAAARIGAISVPMNIRQKAPETEYIVNHCGASFLVFDAVLGHDLPEASALPLVRQRYAVAGECPGAQPFDGLRRDAPPPPPCRVAEEDCGTILYTSGTTGRPKGAMLTHFNMVHSVIHFEQCLGLRAGDRTILAVPASHVTGLIAILLLMVRVGGASVMMEAFKARAYLELAARERVSMTVMVPAMYNLCLLDPAFAEFDLRSWRIGGFGGAPMPVATIERLAERLPDLVLVNCYGSTEVTSPATCMPLGQNNTHLDSVGVTVPCDHIRIVDAEGRDVAPGESGEIWISGPNVVPGYWNNAEANQKSFADGYWKSGDIGSKDSEGYVRIFDRIKDMINRAGFKIYSAEIENTLSHHPKVVECAAIGRPDPVLGERLQVFVVPKSSDLRAEDIKAFCAERMSDYKVPDFVTLLSEPLPRNPNGKILKTKLRDLETRP